MMKCDNLKACLDGELSILNRFAMLLHIRLCKTCRRNAADWTSLSCDIEQLEGDPVPPALRDKLMADALSIAAKTRSQATLFTPEPQRQKGVSTMRKVYIGASALVLLIVLGLCVLPLQKGNYALADMASAMAKVSSVHFTGFAVDSDGDKVKLEGWVKGTDKLRIRVDDKEDIADDGERLVAVELGRLPKVTVRASGDLPGLAEGMTYLDLFSGVGSLRSAIAANGAEVRSTKKISLPDGRAGVVTELEGDGGARMRIFTDAHTDLLARSETYDRSGKLIECVEQVEYNVAVSDSVFKISVPKDLPVLDMVSPSEQVTGSRKAEFERLQNDPNAKMLMSIGRSEAGPSGRCATFFHPGFQFELYGPGLIAVFYLADKNVYHIIGKGQAYNEREGWRSDMVEDGDIRLPGEPQIEDVLMLNGKVGDFCGKGRAGAYRFLNIGPGPATVTYHKVKDAFVIRGTVKALPTGKVYTNEVALPNVWLYGDDGVRSATKFNRDIIDMVRTGGKPDWGGLPDSEIESMRADMDTALRMAKLDESRNARGLIVIAGAEVTALYGGGSRPHGILIEPAGPGTQVWILEAPSREELYVIGRARVRMEGKPDRTVKNGVVSYDGEIISSED